MDLKDDKIILWRIVKANENEHDSCIVCEGKVAPTVLDATR